MSPFWFGRSPPRQKPWLEPIPTQLKDLHWYSHANANQIKLDQLCIPVSMNHSYLTVWSYSRKCWIGRDIVRAGPVAHLSVPGPLSLVALSRVIRATKVLPYPV